MNATPSTAQSPQYDVQSSISASPDSRSAKRQKVTRACDSCKARKRRCTGELPCKMCLASGASCTYLASYTRGRLVLPQSAEDNYKSNVGSNDHLNSTTAVHQHTGAEPYIRPSRAVSPEGGPNIFAGGQYSGPTSSYTFLYRVWKRLNHEGSRVNHLVQRAPEESASSGKVSIFTVGDRLAPSLDTDGFRMPERSVAVGLVDQYFDVAMPTHRFFHKPTVLQWLEDYYQQEQVGSDQEVCSSVRQAAVLLILATSLVFNVMQRNKELSGSSQDLWQENERMFCIAQSKLQSEQGRPILESVQARLASVLYLLQVSRPNQAYYLFGTTVQLAISLGLHRASVGLSSQHDRITRECRKRTFWAASTLDTYLCVILGRPALIHLDDVDQLLPDAIDDEDLVGTDPSADSYPPRDSVIRASILHAQIARIVKKATREQCSVHRKTARQKLEGVIKFNEEIKAWHEAIPVVLSGAIHPSSLIPVFRRQVAVLQLAHAHARMLVNRPSCTPATSQTEVQHAQVHECVSAAKSTLDIVLAASLSKHNILWHTQFVTFNALSIVYIFLIDRKPGNRLYLTPFKFDEQELLQLAETVQRHLVEATHANAPSLRYSVILGELLQEVKRGGSILAGPNGVVQASTNGDGTHNAYNSTGSSSASFHDPASCTLDMMDVFANFPIDDDLWFAIDSLPFSDFG